jgi:Zn-dependent M28 family amino/carboxypeptidase
VGIRGSEGDTIYNGANDNATGSTAVLQVGSFLAQFEWDQNIVLALFADEEKGLRGAYHLAQRFKDENIKPDYMINFEMIGKTLTTGANQVYMTGYNYSNMPEVMNTISPNFVQFLPEAKELNLFRRSDNYAFFQELETPAFTLSSFDFKNFDFYHKAGDEAEKMEVENMNQIISTAAFTIAKMIHLKAEIQMEPAAVEE